jgi:membrane protease YdiL (CAAX protease family)
VHHHRNVEHEHGFPVSDRIRLPVSIAFSAAYVATFLIRPASYWPNGLREVAETVRGWLLELINAAYRACGIHDITHELRSGAYFLITSAVLPWILLALARRGRPHDIGVRPPNRIGWRILVVGYVLALPFQVWMVRSASFAPYYMRQIDRAGLTAFLLYYLLVILVEHFFFHGVLLAACRTGGRWPAPAPVRANAATLRGRALQWIGLCQPGDGTRGLRRLVRWIGLPEGCIPAILTSALLFAAIHLGKDPRELILSLPGGIALAYLAYRTNSWLIPFLLHSATAATACALMPAMA